MMKRTIKPVALAVALAFAAPTAMAVNLDFSGSNIYMKFLAGDQRSVNAGATSGDTASGTDNGQWTEMELRIKATISPKVEAGVRIQSRSPSAYWTEFGFKNELSAPERTKFMKLRGAYVQLTPGYSWLNTAIIGSSDWGMFDPFTMGKMRYIDRDNLNGFYFKGPLGNGTYEAARVSLPEYLGANYDTGNTPKNEAVYIGQLKQKFGAAKLTGSYTYLNNESLDSKDLNPLDGKNLIGRMKNTILSLKADAPLVDGLDFRGALHHSTYNVNNAQMLIDGGTGYCATNNCGSSTNAFLTTGVYGYSMTPGRSVNDNALKLDLDWTPAAAGNFTLNYQYFNIGKGYVTVAGARRESDVLLTEGAEAAWYNWGGNRLWLGGAANDFQQVPVIHIDNDYMDFDEPVAQSVIGWKGHTFKFNYETAETPMSLELTKVGYNTNWQNFGGNAGTYDVGHGRGDIFDVYQQYQDRSTNIAVFKASHTFKVAGGLVTSFKYKRVADKDTHQAGVAADDVDSKDSGYIFTVGNQLHNDLYGSVSYGKYKRNLTVGGLNQSADKDIWSARFSYNLSGFEAGMLTQWIDGRGYLGGKDQDFSQYRLKAFLKAIF